MGEGGDEDGDEVDEQGEGGDLEQQVGEPGQAPQAPRASPPAAQGLHLNPVSRPQSRPSPPLNPASRPLSFPRPPPPHRTADLRLLQLYIPKSGEDLSPKGGSLHTQGGRLPPT